MSCFLNRFVRIAFLGFFLCFVPYAASAATIDSAHKYAWSNNGGWVNFAPSMSTVTVTDSELTGYAWSANNGWINLAPSNGGVENDGSGNLSGSAWDERGGWISFDGVSIDADGHFVGQATGDNGYVLTFDCAQCDVRTDWRPAVTPSGSSGSSRSGSIVRHEADEPISESVPDSEAEPVVLPPTNVNIGSYDLPDQPQSMSGTSSPTTVPTSEQNVTPPSGDEASFTPPMVTTSGESSRFHAMALMWFLLLMAFIIIAGCIKFFFFSRR